jgi:hypothetical protein
VEGFPQSSLEVEVALGEIFSATIFAEEMSKSIMSADVARPRSLKQHVI